MPRDPEKLELKFDGCPFGVSARRIHEHMTLAQINPFARSVASVQSPRDAAGLIDLVRFDSAATFSLTGATLAGLDDAVNGAAVLGAEFAAARQGAAQAAVRAFVARVAAAVKQHAGRRAARNVPARFLPPAAAGEPFGVPMLRSRLCEHLATRARAKAGAAQWLATLRNLAQKGPRDEELQRSGLIAFLEARRDAPPLTGKDLAHRRTEARGLRGSGTCALQAKGYLSVRSDMRLTPDRLIIPANLLQSTGLDHFQHLRPSRRRCVLGPRGSALPRRSGVNLALLVRWTELFS